MRLENPIMKTLLSTAAVVALLAAAPAFAAENPVPADQQAPAATDQMKTDDMMKKKPAAAEAPAATDQTKAAETPAATDGNKPAEAAQAPAATDEAKPAEAAKAPAATDENKPAEAAQAPAATDQAKPADKAAAAAPADQPKFITQQSDQERLASKWIGQTIYNQADENLGDVNDLVISQNGQIDAVVIGVGGFLGIGEKNVAVPFTAIQAATDADGNMKLVAQFSKDDLSKAPEFLTLADIKAKQAAPATEAPAPAPAQ
jgi:sporulation protein YlmC with PRC-barrel domain